MRRTLTVLVTTAAFVLPAAAANAAVTEGAVPGPGTNASCNNSKGGNYAWSGMDFNGKGRVAPDAGCRVAVATPDLPTEPTKGKPSGPRGVVDVPIDESGAGAT